MENHYNDCVVVVASCTPSSVLLPSCSFLAAYRQLLTEQTFSPTHPFFNAQWP